jgi:hypothetical protein
MKLNCIDKIHNSRHIVIAHVVYLQSLANNNKIHHTQAYSNEVQLYLLITYTCNLGTAGLIISSICMHA